MVCADSYAGADVDRPLGCGEGGQADAARVAKSPHARWRGRSGNFRPVLAARWRRSGFPCRMRVSGGIESALLVCWWLVWVGECWGAAAKEIRVGPGGAYASVSLAYGAADAGDELVVLPGVHVGGLAVDVIDGKPLLLRGDGADAEDTVLDCGQSGWGFSLIGNDGNRSRIENLVLQGCAYTKLGAAIHAEGVSVDIDHVVVRRCNALGNQFGKEGAGALYFKNTASTVSDTTVEDNEAAFGPVFADGADSTVWTNVTFRGNRGRSFGGAYIPEGSSSNVLEDCVFEHNFAPFGGAVDSGGTSTCIFKNVLFYNNTGQRGGAIFHFGESSMTFDNCWFDTNSAANSGGAIECGTRTKPRFVRTTFIANVAVGQGGAIRATGACSITLEDCFVAANISPRGGGLSASGDSDLVVDGTSFYLNTATLLGGAVECQSASTAAFKKCDFTENAAQQGGAVYLDNIHPWLFGNSSFVSNFALEGGAFYGDSSDCVMRNCTMDMNYAKRQGGAVYASNSIVSVDITTMRSNRAGREGGAAYVLGSSLFGLTNSIVADNTARGNGGAIFTESQLELVSSHFVGNSVTDFASSGAAIYMQQALSACRDSVLSWCSFVRNEAEAGGGGAIFLSWASLQYGANALSRDGDALDAQTLIDTICFPDIGGNSFESNSADYGPDVASMPLKLAFDVPPHADVLPDVASEFFVSLEDYFGNVVASDAVESRILVGLVEPSGCSLPAPPVVQMRLGRGEIDALSVLGTPGTVCSVDFVPQPQSDGLPLPLSANLTIQNCPVGYASEGTGSVFRCALCTPGSYSLQAGEPCQPCPRNAVCSGASVLLARGFWPSELALANGIVEPLPCPPLYCCAEDLCPINVICASRNRSGTLCGRCNANFVDIGGECLPCTDTNWTFIVLILLMCVAFTMWNVLLVRTEGHPDLSQLTFFGQMGLLVVPPNRLRTIAIGASALLKLDMLGLFTSYSAAIDGDGDNCITPWSALGKTLVQNIIPMALFACILLIAAIDGCVRIAKSRRTARRATTAMAVASTRHIQRPQVGSRPPRDVPNGAVAAGSIELSRVQSGESETTQFNPIMSAHHPQRRNRKSSTTVWVEAVSVALAGNSGSSLQIHQYVNAAFRTTLLSYSVVSETILRLILCTHVDGVRVMALEPSIRCYHGEHTPWAIVAWVMLFLWVVGYPALLGRFLFQQNRFGVDLEDPGQKRAYGILYDAYTPKYYLFGAVYLFRRTLCIAVAAVLAQKRASSVFALGTLFLVFLVIHVTTQPYRIPAANLGETFMLCLMVLLCMAQLWIELASEDELTGENARFGGVLLMQAILVAMALFWAVWTMLGSARRKFVAWRRSTAQKARAKGSGLWKVVAFLLCACATAVE